MHKWKPIFLSCTLCWTFVFLMLGPTGGCAVEKQRNEDGGTITLPDGKVIPRPNVPDGTSSMDTPPIADDGNPKPTSKVPCPPTQEFFREQIWNPVFSTQCLSCHHDKGIAKASRFILRFPSAKDAMVHNLRNTMRVASIVEEGRSILLSRATGTHSSGHPGGALISLGSAQYTQLKAFIDAATGKTKTCSKQPSQTKCTETRPGQQMLRRLTRQEYDNTIRDLFGFASKWGTKFVADNVVEGFDNNAAALTVTPLLADQLRIAAEEIAAKALQDPKRLLSCDIKTGDRSCARSWIRDFGMRIYREPLGQGQIDALLKLFDLGAKESFLRGIELTLSGMLQSPFFLYRRELGTRQADGLFHLSNYEIASSLSYLFWGTMPDQELFRAVKAGSLQDPKEIEKQARRLLASPRSRFVYTQFFTQWMMIQRITSVPKDSKIFAAFSPAIRSAMMEEFKRFIGFIMEKRSGTLDEILTSRQSVVNSSLAQFYGVTMSSSPDPSGYGPITFTDGSRGGLLTLGSVLAVHGRPDSSSPIHRGVLVRERLLCQHLPPPPANVDAEPPGLDPRKTTRERYVQHSKDPTCKGCHSLIDPIGFGFEQFDGIGRFRTMEQGRHIDAKGEILNAPHTPKTFDGLRELSANLAKSKDVHQCFTLQWMRWAYGMKVKTALKCVHKQLSTAFSTEGRKISELLIALTQTQHFRMRLPATGVPTTHPGPGEPGEVEPTTQVDAGTVAERDVPPEDPDPSALLNVNVRTQSKWNAGYCNQIRVTNPSTQDVVWSIQLQVDGTITQLWNAVRSGSGKRLTFSGVAWNATLKPKQQIQFGFCAKTK